MRVSDPPNEAEDLHVRLFAAFELNPDQAMYSQHILAQCRD